MPGEWRLACSGRVRQSRSFDYAQLVALATLDPRLGLGIALTDFLAEVGVETGAEVLLADPQLAEHRTGTYGAQRVMVSHPWHHEPLVTVSADPSVLLQRVQTGDRSAFSELYDALAPMVSGTVKRVLRDPAMSEAVTQEVFLEIWKTADRFDPERAKASTWAVTLARRRAVDRVRHEQSQRNRVEELSHQPVRESVGPEHSVVSSLDTERVARALAQLPDDQREVITLAFIDGLAHSAIAEKLDLPSAPSRVASEAVSADSVA